MQSAMAILAPGRASEAPLTRRADWGKPRFSELLALSLLVLTGSPGPALEHQLSWFEDVDMLAADLPGSKVEGGDAGQDGLCPGLPGVQAMALAGSQAVGFAGLQAGNETAVEVQEKAEPGPPVKSLVKAALETNTAPATAGSAPPTVKEYSQHHVAGGFLSHEEDSRRNIQPVPIEAEKDRTRAADGGHELRSEQRHVFVPPARQQAIVHDSEQVPETTPPHVREVRPAGYKSSEVGTVDLCRVVFKPEDPEVCAGARARVETPRPPVTTLDDSILAGHGEIERRHAVVAQVMRSLRISFALREQEVRIKLEPQELGEVWLKVTSGPDGVKADFRVNSEIAEAAIREGLEDLRQGLTQTGVRVAAMTVGMGLDWQQGAQGHDRRPRRAWYMKHHQEVSTVHQSAMELIRPSPRLSGGIDMIA